MEALNTLRQKPTESVALFHDIIYKLVSLIINTIPSENQILVITREKYDEFIKYHYTNDKYLL